MKKLPFPSFFYRGFKYLNAGNFLILVFWGGVIEMRFEYKTQGTCSQVIYFDINGDIISNVEFIGGCNGNLQAVSKLVEGMTVSKIEEKLAGIHCGNRATSCADQLSQAVRMAKTDK